MDLSGIAALLALASIPVSVLIARWQMQAALAQTEANYRSALEAAEVNYRAALEVAQANHRHALVLARNEMVTERARWLADAQAAAFTIFQKSLAQFRRTLLANEIDVEELHNAFSELHNAPSVVRQVAPDDVSRLAINIMRSCQRIEGHVRRGRLASYEERAEVWRVEVSPLRDEMDEAIKRVHSHLWE